MLATMSFAGTFEYILYLLEQEQDDTLWSIWLNKDIQEDYHDFAKERRQPLRRSSLLQVDTERAKQNIESASLIVKPRRKETMTNGE